MAFQTDENGNITLIQGDSGILIVSGISTDKNYTVYFAVQDRNRKPIGSELFINSNKSSEVAFYLTGAFTDLLKVEKNESFANYYYGIKVCDADTGFEDTLVTETGEIGDLNVITVYPKKVEGI